MLRTTRSDRVQVSVDCLLLVLFGGDVDIEKGVYIAVIEATTQRRHRAYDYFPLQRNMHITFSP